MPSHRKRRDPIRMHIPGRYLLLIVTIVSIALIAITYSTNIVTGPLNSVANYVIVPFQNGVSDVGSWFVSRHEMLESMEELRTENASLTRENQNLRTENTNLQQEKYELSELRTLYALDNQYSEYEKTGARVIAKDAGNWYHAFVIDKGANDGLLVDMNVLSGAGLVGRITAIGPNWARVDTIIDDGVNVTAMVLSNNADLIVSGNLEHYDDGTIDYSRLRDPEDEVQEGEKVVTSNISDKYLPGILIGYINTIQKDPNNLTKSGELTPAVDFGHLNTVLVILQRKQDLPEDTTVSDPGVSAAAAAEDSTESDAASLQDQSSNETSAAGDNPEPPAPDNETQGAAQ